MEFNLNLSGAGRLILFLLFVTQNSLAQFDRYPKIKETPEWKKYFVDSLGKPINNEIYDNVHPFMGGMAMVEKRVGEENHSGLINSTGKLIVPFSNHYIRNEGEGLATVATEHETKIYNTSGKIIGSCNTCEVSFYNDVKLLSMQQRRFETEQGQNTMTVVIVTDYNGKEIFRRPGNLIERLYSESTRNTGSRNKNYIPFFSIEILGGYNYYFLKDIVSLKGELIFDSVYGTQNRELLFWDNKLTLVRNNHAMVVDEKLKQILPMSAGYNTLFEVFRHPAGEVYSAGKNGKYGMITIKNETVVPFIFDRQLGYSDSTYRMSNRNGDSTWTLNMHLDTLEEPGYFRTGIKTMDKNSVVFQSTKNGRRGIMNSRSRKIIVPAIYTGLVPFSKDSILYFIGDTAGIMNAAGKSLFNFPQPCYGASRFQNGRALCVTAYANGKPGTKANSPDELMVKYVWLDPKGNIINNAVFDWFARFENGMALVNNDGRYFMVDTLMRPMRVQQKYDYYSYFRQGYAIIGQGAKKFGLIDKSGKIVIPVEYDGIGSKSVRDQVQEYRNIQDGIPFYDKDGNESVTNGFFYIPDINDGIITVTKGETETQIVLFGNAKPQDKPKPLIPDSISLWYNTSDEIVIREREYDKIQIPLNGNEVEMIPFRQDELFGFVSNNTGEWLIKPMYEQVHAVYKEGAIVKSEGAYTYVDKSGKVLFDHAENITKEGNVFHCITEITEENLPEPHNRCILNVYYDAKGKKLFSEKAHDFVSFTDKDSLAYFRYGKMLTIRGKSGKVWKRSRVGATDALIGTFNNLLVYKTIVDAKTTYVGKDVKGKTIFSMPLGFDRVEGPFQLSKNFFGFMGNGGIYFCDQTGKQKKYGIEGYFENERLAQFFDSKVFSVCDFSKKKFGVIDREGKILIPFKWTSIGPFNKGYAVYSDSTGQYGLMDSLGKPVVYLNRDAIESQFLLGKPLTFDEGLCPVQTFKLLKFKDAEGKEQVTIDPDSLHYVYFDINGKEVFSLPDSYKFAGTFSEGLAPFINEEGNFGFINRKGEVVIAPEFEATMAGGYPIAYLVVPEFIGGYAYMKGYKGYIDKSGKKYYAGKRVQDEYHFSH